jgi:DNA-directed RNA polymerase subunit M/transcription elongation factor TFIIS
MGVITDILKEIPLSAILKERLAEKELEMATVKSDNAALKSENATLRDKLQKIERDKAVQGDTCPYCKQPKGKLLRILPDKTFGDLGMKVEYYKCEDCGKEYDKQRSH